ncbi:hypothetical protein LCGC14_1391120, partial [marine sediment metagenome]
ASSMSKTDIIIPELAVPDLDPSDWDCPPISAMPEYQQRKRQMRRMAAPRLTSDEWSAWDRIIRELFMRDEEWAVRFAMGHLLRCWGSVSPDKAFRRVQSDHQMDAIYRRNLKREEYEQMFRTWGDIITDVEDVGDIQSAATLLDEVTQYLDGLPTQAEKRLLVTAAHQSSFWRLVRLLASRVGNDPAVKDAPYVIQAHRWIDAWESLRKGQDIESP